MFWKKLISILGITSTVAQLGSAETSNTEDTERPKIPIIEAKDNQWGVSIFDVRPVTHVYLSTSENQKMAENAVSYGRDDGKGFIGQAPPNSKEIKTDLTYKTNSKLYDGVLFAPNIMEHKWAIFFHNNQILVIRSWKREVQLIAQVKQSDGLLTVESITGTFVDGETPEMSIRTFDFLMRTHALNTVYPAPLLKGMGKDGYASAMWCMSMFGKMASCATEEVIPRKIPENPIRSHSLLHIALAQGKGDEAQNLIELGWPIDLLAGDGLATMHWATARNDTKMISLLLTLGANIDMRSNQGATALMNTVQSKELEKTKYLIEQGADLNAKDNRGFTALHRAAEMGHLEITKLLLEKGAKVNVDAEGHTPLSLAKARKNNAIIELINNSK